MTAQTVYSDLLARLQDDALIAIPGSPKLIERSERFYWYTTQRFAGAVRNTYLGPDSPELRQRIERTREQAAGLKARDRERGRFVRMLREAGYPSPDAQTGKVLSALAKAGAFRLRAVLVGSHAFGCYPAILGRPLESAIAKTEDIDLAQHYTISLALDDRMDPAFAEVLQSVETFRPRPSPRHYAKSSGWRGESGTAVELLTTMKRESDRDELIELKALGAFAQPLPFLDFLIQDPIPAAVLYRYGVLVNVPQPARYAVHKLIVATRRRAQAEKVRKDIAQAADLIAASAELNGSPDDITVAYEEARSRGPKWKSALAAGVRRLPQPARDLLLAA
ncbi:MAG: hypothetical protein MI920_22835 [Kiloniellales bacterium]|nr:hypothetical protein [Kiloniellales bacterium]